MFKKLRNLFLSVLTIGVCCLPLDRAFASENEFVLVSSLCDFPDGVFVFGIYFPDSSEFFFGYPKLCDTSVNKNIRNGYHTKLLISSLEGATTENWYEFARERLPRGLGCIYDQNEKTLNFHPYNSFASGALNRHLPGATAYVLNHKEQGALLSALRDQFPTTPFVCLPSKFKPRASLTADEAIQLGMGENPLFCDQLKEQNLRIQKIEPPPLCLVHGSTKTTNAGVSSAIAPRPRAAVRIVRRGSAVVGAGLLSYFMDCNVAEAFNPQLAPVACEFENKFENLARECDPTGGSIVDGTQTILGGVGLAYGFNAGLEACAAYGGVMNTLALTATANFYGALAVGGAAFGGGCLMGVHNQVARDRRDIEYCEQQGKANQVFISPVADACFLSYHGRPKL